MTEPTDDELDAVIAEYRTRIYPQDMHPRFERAIMRAAIAKWGTPPPKWEPVAWNGLTDEDRERAMNSMPGMLEGFTKTWGWLHFAKAIEAICREKNARPAPAYKDSTPELHVGDSAFESWYSAYSPAHKGDKQRASDAYAAGMGDPMVTAAPAAVAGPVVNRTTVIEWLDANDIEVTDRQMDGLFHFAAPTTQPAPQQEVQEPVAWYVTGCGRLLDEDEAKAEARHIGGTARAIPLYTAPQPSPAAQGDALESGAGAGGRQRRHTT